MDDTFQIMGAAKPALGAFVMVWQHHVRCIGKYVMTVQMAYEGPPGSHLLRTNFDREVFR